MWPQDIKPGVVCFPWPSAVMKMTHAQMRSQPPWAALPEHWQGPNSKFLALSYPPKMHTYICQPSYGLCAYSRLSCNLTLTIYILSNSLPLICLDSLFPLTSKETDLDESIFLPWTHEPQGWRSSSPFLSASFINVLIVSCFFWHFWGESHWELLEVKVLLFMLPLNNSTTCLESYFDLSYL